ncbi:MAG: T9SS type A sorting domain-containing protein, partial [Bacteroidota bacterium]
VRITGIVSQFDTEEPLTEGYQILVIADGDVVAGTTSIGEDPDGQLAIGTVTPNPSASGAAVTVSLATAGRATLAVYDVLGREVARVLDGPMPAGDRSVRLDVADLPAGTYIARLTANGTSVVRPFTVAR